MTTTMTPTGEKVKYGKKTFSINSKMTKKGVRFYMYSMGRYFPISRSEINLNICLDQTNILTPD